MPKKKLIFYKRELTRIFSQKKTTEPGFYHQESNFVEKFCIFETVRLSSIKIKFDNEETQFS